MVKQYFLRPRYGFTLVEIMIVVICLSIIIGPIFILIRSGSDSSLKGMMRIDTTLKARIVMQQIYSDLKMACFTLPYGDDFSIDNLVKESGTHPNITYKFYSFPKKESYSKIFEEDSGIIYRNVSHITYKVETGDDPNLPFKKLVRIEKINGVEKSTVLTPNLNYFEIKKIWFNVNGKAQYYYVVTLQLIDVLRAKDIKDKKSGEKLTEKQKDVILADFYDVVYPDYFNSLWNDQNRYANWHTRIKSE